MFADRLLPALRKRFPNRGLRQGSPPAPCAAFGAIHPDVGDIEIYADDDEITVVAGNFTHGHFSKYSYHDSYSEDEKEQEIVEQVVTFLDDVFADRVVFWGRNRGSGGWYYPEHVDDEPWHRRPAWITEI